MPGEQVKPQSPLTQPPQPDAGQLRQLASALEGQREGRIEPPQPDETQLRGLASASEAPHEGPIQPPPPDEEQLRRQVGPK
jgi:hypothetical protein